MLVLLLSLLGGGLLLLLSLILFCPVSYRANYRWDDVLSYQGAFGSCLFRFVVAGQGREISMDYRIFGISFQPGRKEERDKKKKKDRKGKKSKPDQEKMPWRFSLALITRENIEHFLWFLVGFLRLLKPNIFQIHLQVGSLDPGINGMILAVLNSIRFSYPSFPVYWEAIWEEDIFASDGKIQGGFILARLFWHILMFLFSRRTGRILLLFYRQRREAKKRGKMKKG